MRFLVFSFFFLLMANTSWANEQNLYDAVPPADASFVRFVNAQTNAEPVTVTVESVTLEKVAYGDVSAYVVIKQGKQNITFGSVNQEMDFAAGRYYTIVKNSDEKLVTLTDALIENPAKAMIYFYNLSDLDKASLFSSTHNVDIFKDIETGKSTSREINALTFGTTVKSAGKDIQTFENVELKRRVGTGFVLVGKEGNYKAIVVEGSLHK